MDGDLAFYLMHLRQRYSDAEIDKMWEWMKTNIPSASGGWSSSYFLLSVRLMLLIDSQQWCQRGKYIFYELYREGFSDWFGHLC